MKIVIDTNVIASSVFFGGKPRQLLELLFQRKVDAYASPEILLEYQETFDYLIEKYPGKHVTMPMAQIARVCIVRDNTPRSKGPQGPELDVPGLRGRA